MALTEILNLTVHESVYAFKSFFCNLPKTDLKRTGVRRGTHRHLLVSHLSALWQEHWNLPFLCGRYPGEWHTCTLFKFKELLKIG